MSKKFIIGIDIGGTKIAAVLATTSGEILQRVSEATDADKRDSNAVLKRLAEMAREVVAVGNAEHSEILGVGISCGGPLDNETGVILSPPNLPEWKSVPVKAFIEKALELPVRVENDANATALAEWRYGAGKGTKNLIFLTIGTGIGGGLILDGHLYRGTNNLAGEVGHQTILMNGPLCGCGKRGCLEALASGPAIARLARESMMYGRHKRVLALAGGVPKNITAAHVIESAKQGDPFGVQVLEEAGTYLGVGIANLIQLFNPEMIVLGTIAVHAGDLILNPIRAAVKEYAWERSAAVCKIVPAALGDRAQDLAAVALWSEM